SAGSSRTADGRREIAEFQIGEEDHAHLHRVDAETRGDRLDERCHHDDRREHVHERALDPKVEPPDARALPSLLMATCLMEQPGAASRAQRARSLRFMPGFSCEARGIPTPLMQAADPEGDPVRTSEKT